MSWLTRGLARLLGAIPPENGIGIGVNEREYWLLTKRGNMDLYGFLRRLAELFPESAVAYIGGTSIALDVQEFLEARPAESPTTVMTGTYWPRPKKFHLEVNQDNIESLASLADNHAEPEVCDHIVIYRGEEALLEWWDVPGGAILLAADTPGGLIDELCELLGCSAEHIVEGESAKT